MKQLFKIQGQDIIEAVQDHYSKVAQRGEVAEGTGAAPSSCCSSPDVYSAEEIEALTPGATASSAGCGNPVALADIRPGEVVLDLGSGGGIDCFLAAKSVGPSGRVIGVDMTPAMVALARKNAAALGAQNVVFKLGRIEAIPEPDATVDMVMSNCVLALAPDKDLVFSEVYRVLRPGGRLVISDMVVEREMPAQVRASAAEWVSCVGGADLKSRYLARIVAAGFQRVGLLKDHAMPTETGREWTADVRSITVRAFKPLS